MGGLRGWRQFGELGLAGHPLGAQPLRPNPSGQSSRAVD